MVGHFRARRVNDTQHFISIKAQFRPHVRLCLKDDFDHSWAEGTCVVQSVFRKGHHIRYSASWMLPELPLQVTTCVPPRPCKVYRSPFSGESYSLYNFIHPAFLLGKLASRALPFNMATAKQAASDAVQTTKEMEKKLEKNLTLLWEEIDSWQQDNHYIISGYRPASSSYLTSLLSLSYLHNESVNIYTHLLGSLAFLCASGILYGVLGSRYQTATREDVYAFSCFFLGAVACLGMSATFHTISNHSHAVAKWGNQLDYAGIVLLIWGSFVPVLFYGFRRENAELMRAYWTMVSQVRSDLETAI
jgi:hypothetical protein